MQPPPATENDVAKKKATVRILKTVYSGLMLLLFVFSLTLPVYHYVFKYEKIGLQEPITISFSPLGRALGNIYAANHFEEELTKFRANDGVSLLGDKTEQSSSNFKEATEEQIKNDVAFKRERPALSAYEKFCLVQNYVLRSASNMGVYENELRKAFGAVGSEIPASLKKTIDDMYTYGYALVGNILDSFPEEVMRGNNAGLRMFLTLLAVECGTGKTVTEEWLAENAGLYLVGSYTLGEINGFIEKARTQAEGATSSETSLNFTAIILPRYEQRFTYTSSGTRIIDGLRLQTKGDITTFAIVICLIDVFVLFLLLNAAIAMARVWRGKRMKISVNFIPLFYLTLFSCISWIPGIKGQVMAISFSPLVILCGVVGIATIVVEIIYDAKLKKVRRLEDPQPAQPETQS